VVVTRQASLSLPPDVLVAHGLDEAIGLAASDEQPFVIGGGEIFREALQRMSRLYVTWVEADVAGDTYFPAWNLGEWLLVESERHSADAKNEYDTTFCVYDRASRP
jgi:dihydrofolate reductase